MAGIGCARARERVAGFTLVEILIAFLVLAIGILGLASVQINARRNNAFTEIQSMALTIAEQRIELLRTAPSCAPNQLQDGLSTDTTCEQSVTYQNTTLTVTCTYAQWAMPGRLSCAVPPPNCNYIEFTVSVATPTSSNPVVLVGGKDIDCP